MFKYTKLKIVNKSQNSTISAQLKALNGFCEICTINILHIKSFSRRIKTHTSLHKPEVQLILNSTNPWVATKYNKQRVPAMCVRKPVFTLVLNSYCSRKMQ